MQLQASCVSVLIFDVFWLHIISISFIFLLKLPEKLVLCTSAFSGYVCFPHLLLKSLLAGI